MHECACVLFALVKDGIIEIHGNTEGTGNEKEDNRQTETKNNMQHKSYSADVFTQKKNPTQFSHISSDPIQLTALYSHIFAVNLRAKAIAFALFYLFLDENMIFQ